MTVGDARDYKDRKSHMDRPKKTRSKTPTTNTVAFRAPTELLAQLDKSAKQLDITRGELARAIVVNHFESQPVAIADDLGKLLAKTSLIHRNQARSLMALLTTVAKLPPEDAKEIVRTALVS